MGYFFIDSIEYIISIYAVKAEKFPNNPIFFGYLIFNNVQYQIALEQQKKHI